MTQLATQQDPYLAQFEEFERTAIAEEPAWLMRRRKAAIARFSEVGFPDRRNEDWRFTDVRPITAIQFRPASEPTEVPSVEAISSWLLPDSHRLVFVNGHCVPELSNLEELPSGAIVGSLRQACRNNDSWVEKYVGGTGIADEHAFNCLNTAMFRDGACVRIFPDTVFERPLHLVFLAQPSPEPLATYPRNLIVVGKNSQVTLVESFHGLSTGKVFSNAITEVVVGENAFVDHYKIQDEALDAFHVATLRGCLGGNSRLSSCYVGFGGALVRHEGRVVFCGEHGECTLNGLYQARGTQHLANQTVIDHAQPHCTSHELYKGILDGRAHGVFNGKILVRPHAQKTDAKQSNQTLLLSDDAIINTKPQLEIYADDVKCTHGATVGQLNDDAVFYLRSRGIGLEEARSLLTFAFANDIISRISLGSLRQLLEERLLARHGLPEDVGMAGRV